MPDPKPPQLPQGAPVDLRAFIDCTADRVTLRNGKLDWLPLPDDIRDWAPVPDVTYEDGPTPGSARLTISLGFSFEVLASVQDGQLTVDTSGLPDMLPAGVKDALDQWVTDLDAWLRHNKKQLERPRVRPGEITLEKVPLGAQPPAATPVVPGAAPAPVPPTPEPKDAPEADSSGGKGTSPGGGCFGSFLFLGLVLALVLIVGAVAVGVLLPGLLGGGAATPTAGPVAGPTATSDRPASPVAPTTAPSPSESPTSSPVPSPSPSASPSEPPSVAPTTSPAATASPAETPPAPAERTGIVDLLTEYGVLVEVTPDRIEAATIREERGDIFRHDAQQVDIAAPADIEAGFVLVVPELTPVARETLFDGCERTGEPFRQVCGQQRRGEGPVNVIFVSMFEPFSEAQGGSFLIADSDADPANNPQPTDAFPLNPAQAGDDGFVERDLQGRRIIQRFEFDGAGRGLRTDAILLSGAQSVTWIVFGDYGAFTPAINTMENQREYSNDVLGPLPVAGAPFPRIQPYDVTQLCGALCDP